MSDDKNKAKAEGGKSKDPKPTTRPETRDGYSHRSMNPAPQGDSKGKSHGASQWKRRSW